MVTQTTMAKKQVRYGSKQYALEYRLVYQEEKGYGIEVLCQSGTTTERELVFKGNQTSGDRFGAPFCGGNGLSHCAERNIGKLLVKSKIEPTKKDAL